MTWIRLAVVFLFLSASLHAGYLLQKPKKERELPSFWALEYEGMYVLGSVQDWFGMGAGRSLGNLWFWGAKTAWSPDFNAWQLGLQLDRKLSGNLRKLGYRDLAFGRVALYAKAETYAPILSLGLGRIMLPWKDFDYGFRLDISLGYLVGADFDIAQSKKRFFNASQIFRSHISFRLGIFHVGKSK